MEEYMVEHKKKGKQWLLGYDQPTMLDLFVFPFVERIVLLENSPCGNIFYALSVKDHSPNLVKYVQAFRQLDKFKNVILDQKVYNKYLENFNKCKAEGKKPPFLLSYLD